MSQRTEQVSALLKAELGRTIPRLIELPAGIFCTVMQVTCSPDLVHATVWIAVQPFTQSGDALAILEEERCEIQREVSERLTMRNTPVLHFRIDDTEEKASHLESIIDHIHDD